MSYVVEVTGFISDEERPALIDELLASSARAAAVLAADGGEGAVQATVRKSKKVQVSDETRAWVHERLQSIMPQLSEHFKRPLSECEAPQFLRYDIGDFFVPHQDGNTPMVHDDSRFRKVSAVVFLSERATSPVEGTYGGGDLVFHGKFVGSEEPAAVPGTPGSMVIFPSEETHEVTAVTHGVRFTIAAFFR